MPKWRLAAVAVTVTVAVEILQFSTCLNRSVLWLDVLKFKVQLSSITLCPMLYFLLFVHILPS